MSTPAMEEPTGPAKVEVFEVAGMKISVCPQCLSHPSGKG